MIAEAPATLTTGDGVTLEALVAAPAAPRGGVVLCHPHPLYGGDMDNPVVVRQAEVLGEAGLVTLRFNFRGVGRSTGAHGGGAAERLDVETARDALGTRLPPGRPMVLSGYSFGAAVVAEVAPGHPDLAGVILVAPPLARVDAKHFAALDAFGPRLLVVAGSHDDICPADALSRLRELAPSATFETVEGANHFFFGKLYPLGETVRAWTERVVASQA